MSLLSMFERVCGEVGLGEPPLVVTSTDRQIKQLLNMTYRVGNDLKKSAWPKLQMDASFALVAGQEAYPFPADYDSDIAETHWDNASDWPLIGPLSPSEWQSLKHDQIPSSDFERKFRFKGLGINQFFIDPVPDANTAGDILAYEYQSSNWFRPKTWTTISNFAAGSYCFYNGFYFRTILGGVTGSTAPTPTGLNDGGVIWVQLTTAYSAFTSDSDEFNIDENLVGLGVQWNYLANKGLPYEHLEKKYNKDLMVATAKAAGSQTLSLVPNRPVAGGYRNIRVIP